MLPQTFTCFVSGKTAKISSKYILYRKQVRGVLKCWLTQKRVRGPPHLISRDCTTIQAKHLETEKKNKEPTPTWTLSLSVLSYLLIEKYSFTIARNILNLKLNTRVCAYAFILLTMGVHLSSHYARSLINLNFSRDMIFTNSFNHVIKNISIFLSMSLLTRMFQVLRGVICVV